MSLENLELEEYRRMHKNGVKCAVNSDLWGGKGILLSTDNAISLFAETIAREIIAKRDAELSFLDIDPTNEYVFSLPELTVVLENRDPHLIGHAMLRKYESTSQYIVKATDEDHFGKYIKGTPYVKITSPEFGESKILPILGVENRKGGCSVSSQILSGLGGAIDGMGVYYLKAVTYPFHPEDIPFPKRYPETQDGLAITMINDLWIGEEGIHLSMKDAVVLFNEFLPEEIPDSVSAGEDGLIRFWRKFLSECLKKKPIAMVYSYPIDSLSNIQIVPILGIREEARLSSIDLHTAVKLRSDYDSSIAMVKIITDQEGIVGIEHLEEERQRIK